MSWKGRPVSSALSLPNPSSGISSPCIRATGGESTLMCRSEPSRSTRVRRAVAISNIPSAIGPRQLSLTALDSCPNTNAGLPTKKKGRADRLPTRPRETWVLEPVLCDLAQFLRLTEGLELFEALVLDLADSLAGDVEGTTDL